MRYSASSPMTQAQLRRLAGKQVREVTPDGDKRLQPTVGWVASAYLSERQVPLHRGR